MMTNVRQSLVQTAVVSIPLPSTFWRLGQTLQERSSQGYEQVAQGSGDGQRVQKQSSKMFQTHTS